MLFSCLEIMLRKMRESAKISEEKSHHCKYRAEQAGQFGSFFPAPSQVRKRHRQRPCIALLDIFQTAFEACIKFKSCDRDQEVRNCAHPVGLIGFGYIFQLFAMHGRTCQPPYVKIGTKNRRKKSSQAAKCSLRGFFYLKISASLR